MFLNVFVVLCCKYSNVERSQIYLAESHRLLRVCNPYNERHFENHWLLKDISLYCVVSYFWCVWGGDRIRIFTKEGGIESKNNDQECTYFPPGWYERSHQKGSFQHWGAQFKISQLLVLPPHIDRERYLTQQVLASLSFILSQPKRFWIKELLCKTWQQIVFSIQN